MAQPARRNPPVLPFLTSLPPARARAGEEAVTYESLVSVAWRLVPYYLNQWERAWGAECSSMVRAHARGRRAAALPPLPCAAGQNPLTLLLPTPS